MLTSQQIAVAKKAYRYPITTTKHHEHDDGIRLAFEWLDAQNLRETQSKKTFDLKHLIERWAGCYVSQADVEIAARLHPRIKGTYPNFNLSDRLILPSDRRLQGIGQAMTLGQRNKLDPEKYARKEEG